MTKFFYRIVYLFKESYRQFHWLSLNTFITIITIFLTTLFISLTAVSFIVSSEAIDESLDDYTIRIFLKNDFESKKHIAKIQKRLNEQSHIDSLIFISKKEALQEFVDDFGAELVKNIDYNPLPPSFIIYLGSYYHQKQNIITFIDDLRSWDEIEEVSQVSEYIQFVQKWRWSIFLCLFLLTFIFGLFLILIVSNNIKINLYRRKSIIEHMFYCGAQYYQVFTPHLIVNITFCFIGCLFSFAFVYFFLNFLNDTFFFFNFTIKFWYSVFLLFPFLIILPTCHYSCKNMTRNI